MRNGLKFANDFVPEYKNWRRRMNIDFARCEFGQEERDAVNRVMDGYWLASGKENELFEKEFAEYVGTEYAICVNSGSSANLLSVLALGLPVGSKVLSSACGFPATLSPILHANHTPVLCDYDLATHNISIEQCTESLNSVSAIIFAHTMGNPVDKYLIDIADQLGIPVIEDCCEAVGSEYSSGKVGSFGKLGTYSFYPAHQMTALGGGGMIVTNDKELALRCKSLRDWGKIWNWDSTLGDTQTTYSHTGYYRGYTYETIGYNMKLPEANAAFGREQLKRLPRFVDKRQQHHDYLEKKLNDLDCFVKIEHTSPKISWFGYILTFKDGSKYDRNNFGKYLESCGIRHRPFFAGNITKHAPFNFLGGTFPVADKLMSDSLFVGCWPGMTTEMLDYISDKVHEWVILQS